MNDYDEQMDDMDCAVFSGEILETHLEEFQEYISRWQKEIDEHRKVQDHDQS